MNPNVAAERRSGDSPDEQSLSELTKQLTEQTSALAQKEIELAKAELALKGKRLGIGAGAFGAAGLFGLYALGALTATRSWRSRSFSTLGSPHCSSRRATERSRGSWR